MPRRILVIFNPAAGSARRRAQRLRRIIAELERRGCKVAVRPTQGPGDALRLARDADAHFDVIVAAGGDGTVNEVANGVFAASRPLAVVPLGTGNVLANEIGLPRKPQDLARLIAEGAPQPLWPGRAGDRLFVAMTGIGFDAARAQRARPAPQAPYRQARLCLADPLMRVPLSSPRVRLRHRRRRLSRSLGDHRQGASLRRPVCRRPRRAGGRSAAARRAVPAWQAGSPSCAISQR